MALLTGRVAVVTGGAQGLGFAIAQRFVDEGARVVLGDVNIEATQEAADTLGGADVARAVRCDVTDSAEVDALITDAVDGFGGLDIMVNNAGIVNGSTVQKFRLDKWRQIIDVNLTGAFHTIDVAMKPMIKYGNGGAIVLTSSVNGLVGLGAPIAGAVGYTAAKHGMVGLMRAYANFLAPYSIRVNSIHPAGVNTPMIDNEFTRSWLDGMTDETGPDMSNALPVRALEAEDIANAVYWLVSEAGRYVTGVALPVDAGFVNKR